MLFIQALCAVFRSLVLWKGMSSPTLEGWTQDRLHQDQEEMTILPVKKSAEPFNYMYDNDYYHTKHKATIYAK